MKNMVMAAMVVCLLAGSGPAQAQMQETVTYTWNGFPLGIFPDNADVISVIEIFVPRALEVSKVTAGVQVSFERVGDLKLRVYSPEGDEVRLLDEDCKELVNIDTTFDDEAMSGYSDFCPVEPGRGPFRPRGELSDYEGENSFGVWSLTVENDRSSRSGWITGFSVTITGNRTVVPLITSNTIRNAAGLNHAGSIAPGEVISIIGAGVGPSEAVAADTATLPTSLGGTTVTLNGTPLPLFLASAFRIDAQVPPDFEAGGGTLQVNTGGVSSTSVSVSRFFSRPGLYTLQAAGKGQVKAQNEDGTLNSNENPATKGSVITVWASGLGPVDPPVPAGEPAPASALSFTSGEVAASIGGVPCDVLFAGLAPGLTGVYQVNLLVNPGVASGTQELAISVANSSSQPDVTVEVQ
jgi:uncharacterized protein (TIGR03437 family)